MVYDYVGEDEENTLRVLKAKIELLLAEADATIEGDDWYPPCLVIGDRRERL